jgi:hypothetical protein
VIEQTPVIDRRGFERGVTVEGPVGTRLAGYLRFFRYEVRRWRDGIIPDLADAVGEPVRVTDDPAQASRIVEFVAAVPPLVWGRDERGTGEMWNSNSIVSWLLTSAGVDAGAIEPPPGGRAPGGGKQASWWRARPPGSELGQRVVDRTGSRPGERVPSWETYDRIATVSGWPRSFVTQPPP